MKNSLFLDCTTLLLLLLALRQYCYLCKIGVYPSANNRTFKKDLKEDLIINGFEHKATKANAL